MAVHLRRDAEERKQLAESSKDMEYNQQALYCYRKLYSLAKHTHINPLPTADRAAPAPRQMTRCIIRAVVVS
ncbi:hypothetical protein PILCRDRAFT_826996 [Piloderma croceum F 1598]|uniref:USP8 dimerisation domain-containing protein n=1 Tax=Piloderma croceum (strain F 1598) TaxID=765440 RepID=A0A0C3ET53_PILCF|nr:hypothetical protein PILCRDRAFT_826996 [Piloderma croceum F 1598]